MNREKSLVKNTAILSLGTYLPKLTTIITLPLLTGYLTQAEYGIYDLITTLVFFTASCINTSNSVGCISVPDYM